MHHCQDHFVYIMTNKNRTVLYTGVTSSLSERVNEHFQGLRGGFAKKYNCNYLIYYDRFNYIANAIKRESRSKAGEERKS